MVKAHPLAMSSRSMLAHNFIGREFGEVDPKISYLSGTTVSPQKPSSDRFFGGSRHDSEPPQKVPISALSDASATQVLAAFYSEC